MNSKKIITDIVLTVVIVFIVSIVVTFLYSLITRGQGVIDWATSFRFAIILGIALPLLLYLRRRNDKA